MIIKYQYKIPTKFLGLWPDGDLNWNKHLCMLLIKLKQNTGHLRGHKRVLDTNTVKSVSYAHFHSHLIYSLAVWGSTVSINMNKNYKKYKMYV